MTIFLLIRLIEFRGYAEKFAKRTVFFRRFGIPAFTIYAFHRFWAWVPVKIISIISGVSYYLDGKTLSFSFTMLNLLFVFLFIHLILILWEKIGYIGSLEWMIGTIGGLIMPSMPKAKSSLINTEKKKEEEKAPATSATKSGKGQRKLKWWKYGMINSDLLLYNAEWVDKKVEYESDAKLAFKLSLAGIIAFPLAFISLSLGRTFLLKQGNNAQEEDIKWAKKAVIISIITILLWIGIFVALSFITPSDLGINF